MWIDEQHEHKVGFYGHCGRVVIAKKVREAWVDNLSCCTMRQAGGTIGHGFFATG